MPHQARELDVAPFDHRAQRDRQHCSAKLDGGPRDGLACDLVATHEIDGRFYCPRHGGPVALEILCAQPEAEVIWVQFTDADRAVDPVMRHIRKWDQGPFEGGQRFERRG